MAVMSDCRHYSTRSLASGDKIERCRLSVNEGSDGTSSFACPEGCLFFERRTGMSAGWTVSG